MCVSVFSHTRVVCKLVEQECKERGRMSSSVKMVEAKLPPGFRFHPRDEELICDYLMRKLTRSELPPFLVEVDLNKSEPWDIPGIHPCTILSCLFLCICW